MAVLIGEGYQSSLRAYDIGAQRQSVVTSSAYVNAAVARHNQHLTAMIEIQNKLQNIKDHASECLSLLKRYDELVQEEQDEQAELQQHLKDHPEDSDHEQIAQLIDDIEATLHGDADGVNDGMHNLGQGRYAVLDDSTVYAASKNHLANNANIQRGKELNAELPRRHKMDVIATKQSKISSPSSVLSAAVLAAKSKGDASYGQCVDAFIANKDFKSLAPTQQKIALEYHSQAYALDGKPLSAVNLSADNAKRLQTLLTSKSFHTVNDQVRAEEIRIFKFMGDESFSLIPVATSDALVQLNNPGQQLQILNAVANDPTFNAKVNELLNDKLLLPQDKSSALTSLNKVVNSELYIGAKDDLSQQKTILNNSYELITHNDFLQFGQYQRDAAVDALLESRGIFGWGDAWALKDDGVDQAIKVGKSAHEPPRFVDPGTSLQPQLLAGRTPKVGMATADSVKVDMDAMMATADAYAKSDQTINDPLRRDARLDPVTYAHDRLLVEHAQDQQYIQTLNDNFAKLNLEYAQKNVGDLFVQGKFPEALKQWTIRMDAAQNPVDRKEIFDSIQANFFTKNVVQAELEKAIAGSTKDNWDYLRDDLGMHNDMPMETLLQTYGDNAPPELAKMMVDDLLPELQNPKSQFVAQLRADMNTSGDGKIYSGLISLVNNANTYSGGDKKSPANLVAAQLKNVVLADSPSSYMPHSDISDVPGGVWTKSGFSKATVASFEKGQAALSTALFNSYVEDPEKPGQPVVLSPKEKKFFINTGKDDWYDLHDLMRDGLDAFNKKSNALVVGDSTSDDSLRDKDSLAFALQDDFGKIMPDDVRNEILSFYSKNPQKANDIQNKYEEVYQQGAAAYRLTQDIQTLKADFTSSEAAGMQSAIDELVDKTSAAGFCREPNAHCGQIIRDNPVLQAYFNRQMTLGVAAESVGASQLVDKQREQIFAWLDSNKGNLSPQQDKAVRNLVNEWKDKTDALSLTSNGELTPAIEQTFQSYSQQLDLQLKSLPVNSSVLTTTLHFQMEGGLTMLHRVSNMLRKTAGLFNDVGAKLLSNFFNTETAKVGVGSASFAADDGSKFASRAANLTGTAAVKPGTGLDGLSDAAKRRIRLVQLVTALPSFVHNWEQAQEARQNGQTQTISSSDLYAWSRGAGILSDTYRFAGGKKLDGLFSADMLAKGGTKYGGRLLMARWLMGSAAVILGGAGDLKLMAEDFSKGDTAGGTIMAITAGGGTLAFLSESVMPMTSTVMKQLGLDTLAKLCAVFSGDGVLGKSLWVGRVSWALAAVAVVAQGVYYAHEVIVKRDSMEMRNNPDYAQSIVNLSGMSAEEASYYMDRNEGSVAGEFHKVKNLWSLDTLKAPFKAVSAGGISNALPLNAVLDAYNVPGNVRLQYYRGVGDKWPKLDELCHHAVDYGYDTEKGTFDPKAIQELHDQMVAEGLWPVVQG